MLNNIIFAYHNFSNIVIFVRIFNHVLNMLKLNVEVHMFNFF